MYIKAGSEQLCSYKRERARSGRGGINITTERGAGPGAEGLGGTPSHLRVPPGGPWGPQPLQRPVPRAGAQRARSECAATAADDLYDCNWL